MVLVKLNLNEVNKPKACYQCPFFYSEGEEEFDNYIIGEKITCCCSLLNDEIDVHEAYAGIVKSCPIISIEKIEA